MIQIDDIENIQIDDIYKLVAKIEPELTKRKELYKRYKRKEKNSDLMFHNNNSKTIVPLERYIVDISAGYLGGNAPKYVVNTTTDTKKLNIIKRVLNKITGNGDYSGEMSVLIDFISKYNDDGAEHYQITKDILSTSASYEIMYENKDNEVIYTRLDPLQTVGIWDYKTPANLIGIVRMWLSEALDGKTYNNVEIITKNSIKKYKGVGTQYDLVDTKENLWGDVPGFAVEQEDGIAIFEPVVDIIKAYEQLIQNTRNTFQYNDEAKLVIVGYSPENSLMTPQEITDSEGNTTTVMVENPDRIKEDEACLKAKVVYLTEDGEVKWVEKDIKDTAIQNTLKTYIDLLAMNTGVPNITDLGFTNADNASAIDRKFFSLEQMTINITKQLQKAYLRRWELIFNRINLKKKSKYDFRDITVVLNKNVPQNNKEIIENWLKLRGLVSDETIIDNLPYDLDNASEQKKVEEQEQKDIEKEVNKITEFNKVNGNNEEITKENNSKAKENNKKEEK